MTPSHQLDTDEIKIRTQISDFQDDAFTATACSLPLLCFQRGKKPVSGNMEPGHPNVLLYAVRSVVT